MTDPSGRNSPVKLFHWLKPFIGPRNMNPHWNAFAASTASGMTAGSAAVSVSTTGRSEVGGIVAIRFAMTAASV